jgi:hypothetical protein
VHHSLPDDCPAKTRMAPEKIAPDHACDIIRWQRGQGRDYRARVSCESAVPGNARPEQHCRHQQMENNGIYPAGAQSDAVRGTGIPKIQMFPPVFVRLNNEHVPEHLEPSTRRKAFFREAPEDPAETVVPKEHGKQKRHHGEPCRGEIHRPETEEKPVRLVKQGASDDAADFTPSPPETSNTYSVLLVRQSAGRRQQPGRTEQYCLQSFGIVQAKPAQKLQRYVLCKGPKGFPVLCETQSFHYSFIQQLLPG